MRVGCRNYVALTVIVCGWLGAATLAQGPRFPLPIEPIGKANEAIFPDYAGWGESQDGSGSYIVLGYYNRNRSQTTIEIPIGPNNRIEPGGPDYGQPTVFGPGRQTTLFAIKVPKDFGNQKLTWTLVANGQPAVVTFYLNPMYKMDLYRESANRNIAPKLKLDPNEPMMMGPNAGIAKTLTGSVGQPVALKAWASDSPPEEKNWESVIKAGQTRPAPPAFDPSMVAVVDGRVIGGAGGGGRGGGGGGGRGAGGGGGPADITVVWTKMRGPGAVSVTPPSVPLTTNGDGNKVVEANATATFSAPGEYVLRVAPVESSDFDGLCCFTFANVKVVIK